MYICLFFCTNSKRHKELSLCNFTLSFFFKINDCCYFIGNIFMPKICLPGKKVLESCSFLQRGRI